MDVVARSTAVAREDLLLDIAEQAIEHVLAPAFFMLAAALLFGGVAPIALDAILRPNAAVTQVPIALARLLVLHAAPIGVALLFVLRSAPRLRRARPKPAASAAALAIAGATLALVLSATAVLGGVGLLSIAGLLPFEVSAASVRASITPSFVIVAALHAATSGAAIALVAHSRRRFAPIAACALVIAIFTLVGP